MSHRVNKAGRGEVDWPGEDGAANGDLLRWDTALGRYTPYTPFCVKSANQSFTSTGLTNVDDMLLPLPANETSVFRFSVSFIANSSTTGLVLGIDGAPTNVFVDFHGMMATSQTTAFYFGSSAFGVGATGSGSAGPTQPLPAWIEGAITMNDSSGTLQLQAGTEVQGAAATILQGSWGRIN